MFKSVGAEILAGVLLAGAMLPGAMRADAMRAGGRANAAASGGALAGSNTAASAPTASDALELRIQAENARLARERAAYPAWFAEAYRQHPSLPEGCLEAIAFVGSRWTHRVPVAPVDDHFHMPQTYGLMGLYHGVGGFRDVVAEAAAALGVSEARVIQEPRTQILATAALLERYLREAGIEKPGLEDLGPALFRLSGLPDRGAVSRYALDSYFYDFLLTLDRGFDDNGIHVRDREILWELAFDAPTLELLRAPLVRIAVEQDRVFLPDAQRTTPQTTDYAPALWVSSPNYSSRNGSAITNVAIHTMEGSYSGAISWCQNPDADVSAHYLMRSSDGQVTQMVREYDKAWHVGSENYYTIGIEHEGYVSTSSYYTTAMYNSSSALTRDICTSNKIDCSTCYGGASSSTTQVLSNSYRVKGHQHYQNQDHTDPGIYWDWPKYKSMVSSATGGSTGGSTGGTTGTSTVLDSFESSEGHFNTSPTYSGTTTGISTSSTADRSTGAKKSGSYAERLTLVDNASSSSSWKIRFLSGSGDPNQNTKLTRSGGTIGFWVYTAASGVTASILLDDSDGVESSTGKTFTASTWTWLEWKLDDAAQWSAWYNGNGQLDASSVTIDAILLTRAQTSSTVYIYIDDVTYKH